MLLAIDIGNTNTVMGIYDGDELIHNWRLETKKERTGDEWGVYLRELLQSVKMEIDQIDGAIISSVVPQMQRAIDRLCERYIKKKPILVGPEIKIDMPIATDNPAEVGADRIVNSVAAFHKYKTDLIIIDFGTATTFDYVSKDGEYMGGLILPGLGISMEALFSKAAKLPRVDIAKPKNIIGKSTVESMQSGIYYGYSGMIDSVVETMEKEIGRKAKVIATGGIAPLLIKESKKITDVDEFLTLEGLKLIFNWNKPNA